MKASTDETLLTFPCDFVIKAFGARTDEFEIAVITILRKHASLREDAITSRVSKDGKYLALTISIVATSKKQLDEIYQDLTANPLVLMAL